jgi:ubiquinone/menaquinone biosynthesis C-methylase UbiE
VSTEAAHSRWRKSTSALGERSAYKKVWDRQAEDFEVASLAVVGDQGTTSLDSMARWSIDQLKRTAGIEPHDVILEIGCGIGRVGKLLSEECLHWFGADISGGMLRHAASRLKDRPNITLVELSTVGLQEFPMEAFDLVYCTVVFMHLFEWDRYRYVEEAYRVLRPGGRGYFDNFPLDSELGWKIFMESSGFPLDRRPAHMSMSSSREELRTYLVKAGFLDVAIHELSNGQIAATGRKPGDASS